MPVYSPVPAEAGAARLVCSTHQRVLKPFSLALSAPVRPRHRSLDSFCHCLSFLRSRHEHRTEVNNSANQKPHPMLTYSLTPRTPAGPNQSSWADYGFINCCELIKRHRPWRCILPREIAELQITGRREQHDNNRLPRQDGWAEMGVAYARACTRHGQPGKARAGKGWYHAINTSPGRGEELLKLKDAAGLRMDGDKLAMDTERRGESLVCSPAGYSSAEPSPSPSWAALQTPAAELPPSAGPPPGILDPAPTTMEHTLGSQEQTPASHRAWIACYGRGSVSLQPVVQEQWCKGDGARAMVHGQWCKLSPGFLGIIQPPAPRARGRPRLCKGTN